MPELPLIARARSHAGSVAFRTATTVHTYQNLLDRSATLAAALLGEENDLNETRVALLVSPGIEYAAAQWAIWRGRYRRAHLPVGDDTGVGVRPDGFRCGHLDVGYGDGGENLAALRTARRAIGKH